MERKINRPAPNRAISLIFEKAEWWYSVIEGKGGRIFHERIFRSPSVMGSVHDDPEDKTCKTLRLILVA